MKNPKFFFLPAFLIFTFSFCVGRGRAQTNQPAPVAIAVMVNSNGVVISPTNFAAANGFGTNSGAGLASNLAPARIYIGNALSNATAQTVSGDLALATNGAATLAATGSAGTYAQATFDSKGRETSGATVLPISAGGSGQTTAGAALAALGGASLTASNNISGGNSFTGPVRLQTIYSATSLTGTVISFDANTNPSADGTWDFTGPGTDSGAGITLDMTSTNADSSLYTNRVGASILSQDSLVSVPTGAVYGNDPGIALLRTTQGPPIGDAPGGTAITLLQTGNATEGHHVVFPNWSSGMTNRVVYNETLKNAGTNTMVKSQDVPTTMDVQEDNNVVQVGTNAEENLRSGAFIHSDTLNANVLKASGKLSNAAFDSTDSGTVSLNAAPIIGKYYQTTSTNTGGPIYDASPGQAGYGVGWNPGNGVYEEALLQAGTQPNMAWCSDADSQIGFRTVVVGGTSGEVTNGTSGGMWNSVFTVNGSFGQKNITQTANYSDTADDSVVLMNGSSLTNTLPNAASFCKGREYIIKNIAASACTVQTSGVLGQKIDGATNYSLSAQYKYLKVISDGTQWWIIGNN